MKPELDRVKSDLETMQKAMGLAPSIGREWIHWLRRDNWLNLWWFLPGAILIVAALVPLDNTRRVLGLMPIQWVGILVSAVLLGMLVLWNRKVTAADGRPAGLVREYKKINSSSGWFFLVLLTQIVTYFVWTTQHQLGGQAVMSGLWLLCGAAVLGLAVTTKLWSFLGWAIPLQAFGLCQPLLHGKAGEVSLGVMFFVAALLSSFIQAWQLRVMEKQHDTH